MNRLPLLVNSEGVADWSLMADLGFSPQAWSRWRPQLINAFETQNYSEVRTLTTFELLYRLGYDIPQKKKTNGYADTEPIGNGLCAPKPDLQASITISKEHLKELNLFLSYFNLPPKNSVIIENEAVIVAQINRIKITFNKKLKKWFKEALPPLLMRGDFPELTQQQKEILSLSDDTQSNQN